jgi:tellurite resistance protein TerC
LLSVDNALAIAAMAAHLNPQRRSLAMNLGYLGAYGFRVLALVFAAQIIGNQWVKLAGALYLLWLMCDHFAGLDEEADEAEAAAQMAHRGFAGTIMMIALMDLSLSVDNVVAAIALSPHHLWPVYVGVTIGIVCLRLVAGVAIQLIERYPVLEHTAFILVGYVGLLLLGELSLDIHVDRLVKFAGILGIVGLSMLYARKAGVRAALQPILRLCLGPMKLVAWLFGRVFGVIGWPFRMVLGRWARD